jgi:hypothetical protein
MAEYVLLEIILMHTVVDVQGANFTPAASDCCPGSLDG